MDIEPNLARYGRRRLGNQRALSNYVHVVFSDVPIMHVYRTEGGIRWSHS